MATKTQGLDKLKAKLLARLPAAARKNVRDANEKNAAEFNSRVAAIVPKEHGDLAATQEMKPVGELGFEVSIGGPTAPYPLHLDAGHMGPGGKPVPGKPFWNVAKRVTKKRAKGRLSRAYVKAAKSVSNGPVQ